MDEELSRARRAFEAERSPENQKRLRAAEKRVSPPRPTIRDIGDPFEGDQSWLIDPDEAVGTLGHVLAAGGDDAAAALWCVSYPTVGGTAFVVVAHRGPWPGEDEDDGEDELLGGHPDEEAWRISCRQHDALEAMVKLGAYAWTIAGVRDACYASDTLQDIMLCVEDLVSELEAEHIDERTED